MERCNVYVMEMYNISKAEKMKTYLKMKKICFHCKMSSAKTYQCSLCRLMTFCSKECLENAWV